jgi:hypothetical protein
MKKILYTLGIISLTLLSSCAKDPVFKAESVDMCGQWYVTCDAVDASGNVVFEDPDLFDIGQFIILTASTANNTATEMLLADTCDDTFWDFRCKITVDPATMTFSATDSENFFSDDCTATVTGGKIIKNGATTPSGQPADAIEFYILFSDDENLDYYDRLYVHGYRYTGFVKDN